MFSAGSSLSFMEGSCRSSHCALDQTLPWICPCSSTNTISQKVLLFLSFRLSILETTPQSLNFFEGGSFLISAVFIYSASDTLSPLQNTFAITNNNPSYQYWK